MADEKDAATEITPKGEETIATPEPKKEDAGGSPESQVDYRAQLEEERAKRRKVEEERDNYKTRNIIEARRAIKPRTEDDVELEEEDQTDIIAEKVAKRLAPAFLSSSLDQEISRYTGNPDKQALIRWHYENSLARSGLDASAVREDVRKAVALADAPRMAIERDEAVRVASVRKNPSLGGSGHGPEEEVSKKPYGWTPEQIKQMNAQHTAATGQPFSEADLIKSWNLFKTGRATAEIPH